MKRLISEARRHGFLAFTGPNNPMLDCRGSRAETRGPLLTLRCLLALRLIHDIEVGAEQPIKEGACQVSQWASFGTFKKSALFPVDCEPNTATRL
jgi:hypothetical protein